MGETKEARPVLDKYDTQILLMSKGHFKDQLSAFNFTYIEGLKGLWAWRCGISSEYVELGRILGHCLELLEKLNKLSAKTVQSILFNGCFNDQLWKIGIQDKETPTIDKLVISCMNELSTIQVKESVGDGGELTYRDLIILEEKDSSFIELMIRERVEKGDKYR